MCICRLRCVLARYGEEVLGSFVCFCYCFPPGPPQLNSLFLFCIMIGASPPALLHCKASWSIPQPNPIKIYFIFYTRALSGATSHVSVHIFRVSSYPSPRTSHSGANVSSNEDTCRTTCVQPITSLLGGPDNTITCRFNGDEAPPDFLVIITNTKVNVIIFLCEMEQWLVRRAQGDDADCGLTFSSSAALLLHGTTLLFGGGRGCFFLRRRQDLREKRRGSRRANGVRRRPRVQRPPLHHQQHQASGAGLDRGERRRLLA